MRNSRDMVYLSLLVAVSLVLSIVESFLPPIVFVPGAKLGLSNIITLSIIVTFGIKEALVVSLIKSLLLFIASGNLISLFYSLPAGILSCWAMGLSYDYFSRRRYIFSLIGISILGAITHNLVQVSIASVFLENKNIFIYLPWMLLISLGTGYFVGISSKYMTENLREKIKYNGEKNEK